MKGNDVSHPTDDPSATQPRPQESQTYRTNGVATTDSGAASAASTTTGTATGTQCCQS